MANEYITDPELLKQLNEGTQTPSTQPSAESEYVTDPELLKQLGTSEITPANATADRLVSSVFQNPVANQISNVANIPFQAGQQFAEQANPALANMAMQNIAPAAVKSVAPVANFAERLPGNIIKEAESLYRVGKQIGTEGAKTLGRQWLETPVRTSADLVKAWAGGHATLGNLVAPVAGQTAGQAMGTIGKGVMGALGSSAIAPENALLYPYNMAAYEQEKIRQNPNLPQYQNNPYAQTVRGETSTQNKAGEANRMKALTSMPYGNVTPQEKAMLDEDMKMKSAIRKKAFEKVMGPVAPGSF